MEERRLRRRAVGDRAAVVVELRDPLRVRRALEVFDQLVDRLFDRNAVAIAAIVDDRSVVVAGSNGRDS